MRVLLNTIVFVGVTLTVVACSPAKFLAKPGQSQQQFKRDSYLCHRDASGVIFPDGDPTLTMLSQNHTYENCMDSLGYTKAHAQP